MPPTVYRARTRIVPLALAITILLLGVCSPASAEPDTPAARMADALDRQLSANHVARAAYVVIDGPQEVYGGRGSDKDTPFVIGSVSKSFAAVAAMRAVDDGLISLDAPVETYLPGFHTATPFPGSSEPIRIRHLLNHTTGISRNDGDENDIAPAPDLAARVAKVAQMTPVSAPGTRFEYSNMNFAVLGLVLEKATGKSYQDYLQQSVLQPLGMTHTYTDMTQARQAGLAEGALPYFGFSLPAPEEPNPQAIADGYLMSCAQDMARYVRFQMDGTTASGQPLLSEQSFAALHTKTVDDPEDPPSGYAMGLNITPGGANTQVAHEGSTFSYNADMVMYPQQKRAFVVLTAQGGQFSQAQTLRTAALDAMYGDQVQIDGKLASITLWTRIVLVLVVLVPALLGWLAVRAKGRTAGALAGVCLVLALASLAYAAVALSSWEFAPTSPESWWRTAPDLVTLDALAFAGLMCAAFVGLRAARARERRPGPAARVPANSAG